MPALWFWEENDQPMIDDGLPSPTGIDWRGDVGVVRYGNPSGMVCMFYNKPVQIPAKSAELGRPYSEDQIYVRIHPPGERLNIVDRRANEDDKRRFPQQWHLFSQQKEQHPEGTQIELLYPEYPAVAANLRGCGVQTIEQCADLSANAIESIGMGAQRYVNEAKKYLDMAAKGASASQMRHELEIRDRNIKVLEKTVEQLKATVEELRSAGAAAPSLAQLQTLISGAMARPQMPMAQATTAPGFDPQSAMINATSDALRPPRRRVKIAG